MTYNSGPRKFRQQDPLDLTPAQARIWYALSDKVHRKAPDLAEAALGSREYAAAIKVHFTAMREKLPRFGWTIANLRGVGYRKERIET